MKQNEIEFYKTMTPRKRGAGAYLRKNILTTDEVGLYPVSDFRNKRFGTSDYIDSGYFIKNNYVFVEEGANVAVYQKTTSNSLVFVVNMPTNSPIKSIVGTNKTNMELVLTQDGKLYSVKHSTVTLIKDFAVSGTGSQMVYNGFYWFISIDTKLYRLDPDLVTVTLVKNTTASTQTDIVNMQIFNDYIVITRKLGWNVQFDFWSITTASLDEYQKRVTEENCVHLAMGGVDGTLLFVKSIGNTTNIKEKQGEIIVTAFDGEKFVKLNSIRAFSDVLSSSGSQSQSIGNGIMVVSLAGNYVSDKDLGRNWVLKIKKNGEIETIFEPKDITNGDEVRAINIEYSSISMLLSKTDGNAYFYYNEDNQKLYANYPDYTTAEYSTNFLNNAKNVHKLVAFGVSFEKVFEQMSGGETLYIDYRTSERDSWTLLHEVNTLKIKDYTADEFNMAERTTEYNSDTIGQTIQSYVVTQMPDGTELPRFNEIQFRFRTENGFSVLNAWYKYDYIIRNTI